MENFMANRACVCVISFKALSIPLGYRLKIIKVHITFFVKIRKHKGPVSLTQCDFSLKLGVSKMVFRFAILSLKQPAKIVNVKNELYL